MVAEHRDPRRRDVGQVLGAVIDDVDRDPRDLLRPGSGRGEREADVGERLAGLGGKVAGSDELALRVFGHLPCDEDEPAAGRRYDLCIALWGGQFVGIDALESHRGEPYLGL
jgi:hypothetical protein